jgi:hypothetical protein
VNKQQWHLAILRSGHGPSERAAWLSYDVGGGHGHRNGMNLGLFALGLDLMPDFGYPPVQFGGWGSEKANWYTSTFAHNTVVVDGKEQDFGAAGATKFWSASEDGFSAITASGEAMYASAGVKTYQRTVAMVDTSDKDSYVVDIFRVAGGSDHAKFFLTHFGKVTPAAALKLEAADDYKHPLMRNWKAARNASPGWAMTHDIEDRYKILPEGDAKDLHVRYTDLTSGADAYLGECWIVPGAYNVAESLWQPRVMTRRRGKDLKSTFVGIIEPYRASPLIKKITRGGDEDTVVLEVERVDGKVDRIEAAADGKVSLQRGK